MTVIIDSLSVLFKCHVWLELACLHYVVLVALGDIKFTILLAKVYYTDSKGLLSSLVHGLKVYNGAKNHAADRDHQAVSC